MVSTIDVDSTDPVSLNCFVQNYDWGIIGDKSLVGKIYQANSGSKIDTSKPFAEVRVYGSYTFIFYPL